MTAEWYYRTSTGQEKGPVTAQKLKELAVFGLIEPTTEIRKGAEGRWITANKVKGLLDAAPPKPTATKTTLPSWMQPQDGDDEAEPAQPRPKSPAPLVRRPPVDADQDEDDRPVPVRRNDPSDVVDAEYTVTSPAKQRSPLLLIGAGVGGTLLVVGLVVVIATQMGGSGKPDLKDRTGSPTAGGPSPDERQRELRLAEERRRGEEQQKQGQAFEEAKKLLTDSLSSAGGTAEANVRKGVELLNQHLLRPTASNQAEAKRLLEHAQITLSDDKAMSLLLSLSDYDRREFAGESGSFTANPIVIVKKSKLEQMSPGFSDTYKTKVEKEGEETKVFIESGDYQSSMANAFYDRLKKNSKASLQQVAKLDTDAKLERERQRQEKERQAVLQNGTDEFKRIVEYPEKHIYGHYYFDGVFGSRFGNMKRDKAAKCYTVAFQCQKKQIFSANFGLRKDEINFVVSDDMGNKLLDLRDSEFFARIHCRIRYGNPDYNTFPMAVIYKIEFYEDATFKGQPKATVE